MSDLTDIDAYTMLGRAVIASQVFETAFVTASKLALKQSQVQAVEDIVPLSISKSFKQPLTALLKELSASGVVDATLEHRVTKLVENRHRIIHRQYLEGVWPGKDDAADRLVFYNLCISVIKESTALAIDFMNLLLGWLERFPSLEAIAREHRPGLLKLVEAAKTMQVTVAAAPES